MTSDVHGLANGLVCGYAQVLVNHGSIPGATRSLNSGIASLLLNDMLFSLRCSSLLKLQLTGVSS